MLVRWKEQEQRPKIFFSQHSFTMPSARLRHGATVSWLLAVRVSESGKKMQTRRYMTPTSEVVQVAYRPATWLTWRQT